MSLLSELVALFLLVASLMDMGFRHPTFCAAVVTIKNNGYQGLMVAIHNDVPDNPELLTKIKDTITSASKHLHTATRLRSYFNDVTIVVPAAWKRDSNYDLVQGGDFFSRAEVRVDKPNPIYGHSPYTEQPGQCGEPGKYIHFTPEFLLDSKSAYGDPAKVFVHEWAHLRYGVFDEHGEKGNPEFPRFYFVADSRGKNKIHPTGCSDNIMGVLRNSKGTTCKLAGDGLPDDDCEFYPLHNSLSGMTPEEAPKASIMYMPALKTANGFCDNIYKDRKHNSAAPNKHNHVCQGHSIWTVISRHTDFQEGSNPPDAKMNTLPKFRVVQEKISKRPAFVLVLDISYSMEGRRIEVQHEAASRFIMFQLPDLCSAGLVSFGGSAQTLVPMTPINDAARNQLRSLIPKNLIGGTAIGFALKEALEVLRRGGETTEGAVILLVTDGEENTGPTIAQVMPELIQAKVVINTIAFGRKASDKLEDLVKRTGGRGFFYDDEDKKSQQVLDTAFAESAATLADIEIQPIKVINRMVQIKANEKITNNFLVDKDVGKNTQFLVTYSYASAQSSAEPIIVLLRSPTGKTYSSGSPEYKNDPITRTVCIKMPTVEPGKWEYDITNTQMQVVDVSTVVKTEAVDLQNQPIKVRSWINDVEITFPKSVKVYAEVKKGYIPVVNASVVATIGRPQGDPSVLNLLDNGAGADTTKGDGVYSGYFAHFSGSGRYTVEAAVVNDGKAALKINGNKPGSRAPPLPVLFGSEIIENNNESAESSFSPEELLLPTEEDDFQQKSETYQPVDEFQRFSSAGAFSLKDWKDEDVIPPNRVTDLKIKEVNRTQRSVQLEWTSPGDDMEEGNATMTELRYHIDPLILLNSFSNAIAVTKLLEGNFRPPHGREIHQIRIEIPSKNANNTTRELFYFAMRARDEIGNVGDVSNLAVADLSEPIGVRKNGPNMIVGYVGVAVGALVLLLVICSFVVYIRANRRNKAI